MSELRAYVDRKLRELFEARLAQEPWWCPVCGESGNGHTPGSDDYLLPPASHECIPKTPNLKGIK